MSKLAERSYVAQTALSNSISRLEKELGAPLFEKKGRNLVLSEYGRAFYQYVEPAVISITLGQQAVSSMLQKTANSISIAIASSTLWGTMIGTFLSRYPQCSIAQRECNIDSIMRELPGLDVDLIIAGSSDFDTPYLEKRVFIHDAVRLYVPFNHRFAGRASIKLAEAKDEAFICQPKTTGFSRFSSRLFQEAGFTPRIVAECDYSLRRDLLRSGVGVVLGTDSIRRAHYFDNCGVPVLVEDAFAVRDMAFFWLKQRPPTPIVEAFINFLLEYYSDPDTLL